MNIINHYKTKKVIDLTSNQFPYLPDRLLTSVL